MFYKHPVAVLEARRRIHTVIDQSIGDVQFVDPTTHAILDDDAPVSEETHVVVLTTGLEAKEAGEASLLDLLGVTSVEDLLLGRLRRALWDWQVKQVAAIWDA